MPKKIFILEDDRGIREIMELILVDEGFEVAGFANIKDFSAESQQSIPDLYILDVMLPDGNGIDVCKELKLKEDRKSVPVMMMSAHVDLEKMQKSCDAQGYITKPFDIYHLIELIRYQLIN